MTMVPPKKKIKKIVKQGNRGVPCSGGANSWICSSHCGLRVNSGPRDTEAVEVPLRRKLRLKKGRKGKERHPRT